jgi:hypothetical protein
MAPTVLPDVARRFARAQAVRRVPESAVPVAQCRAVQEILKGRQPAVQLRVAGAEEGSRAHPEAADSNLV